VATGLLHDVLEDTKTTKEELAALFGSEVAEVVDGVTKIGRYAYTSKEAQQAETFRKMLLAMTGDLRSSSSSSPTGSTTCGRSTTSGRRSGA
jgi:Guanosine polyphosphate pyrophosphohydrolases/synthetases